MVDKTNLKSEARATAMTISHLADGGGVFPFSGAKKLKCLCVECCSLLRIPLHQHRGQKPLSVLSSKICDYLSLHPFEQTRVASVILPWL